MNEEPSYSSVEEHQKAWEKVNDYVKNQEPLNLGVYKNSDYVQGVERGMGIQQQHTIHLWYEEMKCNCEDAMNHLLKRIKGENK